MQTSISATIRQRTSCRSYAQTPVDPGALEILTRAMNTPIPTPFGHQPRFAWITMEALPARTWKKLGTYGVIQGARMYLAGVICPAAGAAVDFGYHMESLILQATALGLGTCWLGGTFTVSAFGEAAGVHGDEKLPAVTPVGYPADHRSLTERLMRRFAGSDHRKPWSDLFFQKDGVTPLLRADAGRFTSALDSVRLAPSASNKQPWRILCDMDNNSFAFCVSRATGYKHLRDISLQDIDMGIAFCHFDMTTKEMGFSGNWRTQNAPAVNHWEYLATWQLAP